MRNINKFNKLVIAVSLGLCSAGGIAAHWGYGSDNGPDKWGDMDPGFAACKTEKFQSPIDIVTASAQSSEQTLKYTYTGHTTEIVNNGHTVQVTAAAGSSVLPSDGKQMNLRQFHFHTPSENHLDGHAFPMEVHFVHDDGAGNAMVVGVFFKEGEANPALEKIVSALPTGVNQPGALTSLTAGDLLPAHHEYYSFTGSLTTPPCSGSVSWAVLKEPLTASKAQIDAMSAVLSSNARPVQPLNGRTISHHSH